MKKAEKKLESKRNIFSIIRNVGIILSMSGILLISCDPASNQDNTTNQDSIDSAKASTMQMQDTIVTQDSVANTEMDTENK